MFLCRKLDLSPNIDLLATRINTQLPIFASNRPWPILLFSQSIFVGLGENGLLCISPVFMADEIAPKYLP